MDDASGRKLGSGCCIIWFLVDKDALIIFIYLSIYFGSAEYLNMGYLGVKAAHEHTRLQRSSPSRGSNSRMVSGFRAETDSLTISRGELGLSWTLPGHSFLILFFTWAEEHTLFLFSFRISVYQSGAAQKGFLQCPSYLSFCYKSDSCRCDGPLACLCLDLLPISSFPGWDHFHPAVYFHFRADTTYRFMYSRCFYWHSFNLQCHFQVCSNTKQQRMHH